MSGSGLLLRKLNPMRLFRWPYFPDLIGCVASRHGAVLNLGKGNATTRVHHAAQRRGG
jgi:hypothetical protein